MVDERATIPARRRAGTPRRSNPTNSRQDIADSMVTSLPAMLIRDTVTRSWQ